MAKVAGGPLFAQSAVPLGAATGESREPRIDSFCLGRLEVTVAEFDACVAASGCEQAQREYDLRLANLGSSKQPADLAQQCNSGQSGRERHPVNCVSFQQAQQFCAWRGARLPTQNEWEYAASEVTPDPEEDHKGTLPVGTFPAGGSAEGILDLFGNVSEWTTGHVGLRGAADGDDSDRRQLYAVLGGGLQPGASRLGSRASRLYMNANARGRTVGFRCALALP
jgi:formylglycine-generating enzyme required for sulfatase activity